MPWSAADLEWLLTRDGAEPGLYLATITGPEVPGAIRLVRNTEDIVSRGQTYSKAWFDVSLPNDGSEMPRATMEMPNVDREIGLLLMEMSSGLTITIELVRASALDTVLEAWRMMKLRVATISTLSVTGELSAATYETEPYGYLRMGPADFPGLWAAL